jgi:hypothetical protein
MAGFVKLQKEFAERGDFVLTSAQKGRVDSLLAESESLKLFVRERMERHEALAGGHQYDVTCAEVQQAYAEYCADKGWNAMPITVVERQLADLMLDTFHVTKSHDRARRQEIKPRMAQRAASTGGRAEMSLDISKLQKVVDVANGMKRARCPACAEHGQDKTRNHLRVSGWAVWLLRASEGWRAS